KKYRIPLVLTALSISLTYSFIGITRIIDGGVSIFTGDAILIYNGITAFPDTFGGTSIGTMFLERKEMAGFVKLSFFFVTLIEILFPLSIFNRSVRILSLSVLIIFHVGTIVFMN